MVWRDAFTLSLTSSEDFFFSPLEDLEASTLVLNDCVSLNTPPVTGWTCSCGVKADTNIVTNTTVERKSLQAGSRSTFLDGKACRQSRLSELCRRMRLSCPTRCNKHGWIEFMSDLSADATMPPCDNDRRRSRSCHILRRFARHEKGVKFKILTRSPRTRQPLVEVVGARSDAPTGVPKPFESVQAF